jgi:hydrogenase expression/formation protein HypD
MSEVFEISDSWWRGFGTIPSGGLKIKTKFARFDADHLVNGGIMGNSDHKNCRCGEILRGLLIPSQCSLFGKTCNPENPVGACMVSAEGACNTYYKYRRDE